MNLKTLLLSLLAITLSGTAIAGDPAAGKEKSKACAACHGENGISQAPNFPHLAGQYPDYMVRALKDYKSGARKNPIMQGQVTPLSQQDMEDIAAYYSQKNGLTAPRIK